LKTKDLSESTHKVDIKIGDTSSFKTKIELKYFIHGQEESKHVAHISKNLHFNAESTGVIIRVHANKPQEAAEKIQSLIDNGKEMAGAFYSPDRREMKILGMIDFEVTHDDAIVSIVIKVKDDCENIDLLAILTTMEQNYHHFQQYIHIGVELKHDLKSLLGDPMPISNFITDGCWMFAHLKTNYSDFYKEFVNKKFDTASPQLKPLNSLLQLLLQKNFNLALTLPELKLDSILSTLGVPSDVLAMDSSIVQMMVPQLFGPFAKIFTDLPNELAQTAVTLLKENLQCNFSVSIKLAEAIFTFHVKTAGVNELDSLATGGSFLRGKSNP